MLTHLKSNEFRELIETLELGFDLFLGTFDEIRIEIWGVFDEPRLTSCEIGTEFAVFRRKRANSTVQNLRWFELLCHRLYSKVLVF